MSDLPQSLDARVRFAIGHRRLIEIRYKGSPRVAEPHDYGVQQGIERLFVFQLRGPVRSPGQGATGWRLLDTSKIEAFVVLDETFKGSRGESHRSHLVWDVVYARVT